jgi:lipopolysaccharide/colanic/teichoic acid biosynthesis glycosyltransferase
MTDLLARWPADPPEPPGAGRSAPVDGVAEAPAAVRGIGGVLKSVTDLTVALVLLVLVAPLLLGIALAVCCDGGPAFYRQIRVGRDGVPLRMLKFRSMRVDADRLRDALRVDDEGAGPLFKLRADPRVTRVGALLRRFSLDELPQLFNVLTGQMSLVGPRPALPEEVATYDAATRRRLAVRPGMTGLWQVSGRSDLSWPESVALDLTYVERWSPALDLKILARTVRAVLGGAGAY